MKILLTNDDGMQTKSTFHLAKLLKEENHETDIIIPEENMSGIGSAMSLRKELIVNQLEQGVYTVTGTPSDCINLFVAGAILDKDYDLVISGINSGENAGFTVYDSGTVAAARRAKMYGYNSIAASYHNIHAKDWEMKIMNSYLVNMLNENNFFMDQQNNEFININLPKIQIPENVSQTEWLQNLKIVETNVGNGMYMPYFAEIEDNKFIYNNSDGLDRSTVVNGCDHDTIIKGMVSVSKIKLF